MEESNALRVAIDLFQVPSRVRRARQAALPDDIPSLLRIAAGEEEAIAAAAQETGRSPELVTAAAQFFVRQILLAPGADCYRVLGCAKSATTGELRRNLALILRGLHPDVPGQVENGLFAQRVTQAWEMLKTVERRRAYDEAQQSVQAQDAHETRTHFALASGPTGTATARPRAKVRGLRRKLRRWLEG
jgi:hypothetical protein